MCIKEVCARRGWGYPSASSKTTPMSMKQLRIPPPGCIPTLGNGALGRNIFLRDFYLEEEKLLKGIIKLVLNVPFLPPMPPNSRLQPVNTCFLLEHQLKENRTCTSPRFRESQPSSFTSGRTHLLLPSSCTGAPKPYWGTILWPSLLAEGLAGARHVVFEVAACRQRTKVHL